jgi:diguanylate cyclase (GGDEF)-like protein
MSDRTIEASPHTPSAGRRHLRWLPEGSSLPDDVWAHRHHWILALLWAHVPAIFVFALFRDQTVLHSVGESSIVAAFALLATVSQHHRRLSTVIASTGLLTCSAVLVHLSSGSIEMHFHYFVMVGVITLYQDWLPFIIAIGYVVFQHGVGGLLFPASVYDHESAVDHPWTWATIHGGFILAMSSVGIVTWRLNESLLKGVSERQERLTEAQEVARLGSWDRLVPGGETTWSDEMFRLLDYDPLVQVPSIEAYIAQVHADDRERVAASAQELATLGVPYAIDARIVGRSGEVRWLQTRGKVTEWADGRPAQVSGTAQDVTEAKQAETDLRETLSLLSATLDSTADGILVVDGSGHVTSLNRRFVEMWRLPDAVVESRDDEQALAYVCQQLRDPEGFRAKIEELYGQPEAESSDVIDFLDGRVFERFSTPQRVDGVTVGRVWSFHDVTEQKRLEHELAHQAFHDSLTDLANQALFRDRVEHGLARVRGRSGELAVLFVDLDNFKTVNDSLGHTAGDELIMRVAERLQGCLRPTDTAARLGGDEFALLIEDYEAHHHVMGLAERLIESLQEPFGIAARDVVIGASIGIAFNSPGMDTDQLLRNADLAMYSAKRRGKGRFETYEPGLHSAAVQRLEIEGDLRRALERSELTVHYQPIVALAPGEIVGVEALVRWNHPERGPIPPTDFIPGAEENGLIGELGRQVLDAACHQVRRWQLAYPAHAAMSVNVNLSPRQLRDSELVGQIASVLDHSGLAPHDLVLEITEGAMMHDVEAAIRRLHEVKELGVRLAVDDFGTGYSSLSYLQRFPVDILKIDRAFVSVLETEDGESSLANAIISLARAMRLTVVAEGVETEVQAESVRALGCDRVQGYYFARPLTAGAVEHLLVDGLDQHPEVAPLIPALPAIT